MKKAIKILSFGLLGLLLVLLSLLLAHPLWLSPVAKGVARSQVPAITGTAFRIDDVSLNAYTGKFSCRGVELENPQGYAERIALKIDNLDVVADMESVTSNVVVIKEVTIKGVFVSYVSKDGVNNFDQIAKNASAESKDAKAADEGDKEQPAELDKKEAKEDRKVVIRRLNVSDAAVKLGMFTLPVPPIELHDVGEKSGGVTLAELGDQLLTAIMNGSGAVKDGIGALGAILGDGAKNLKQQLKQTDTKAIKDAAGILKSFLKQ